MYIVRISNQQPLTHEETYNSTFNDLYHYSEKGNEFHTKITLCYTHGVLKVKLLSIDQNFNTHYTDTLQEQ